MRALTQGDNPSTINRILARGLVPRLGVSSRAHAHARDLPAMGSTGDGIAAALLASRSG
ncbi:hypothetical protein XAP6164_1970005 [Xanthomonas phaseoli pv. phaseoli]|nr:hypothetical protein XAP6164_1970005 [Xanthomonas phaseoli pv. phaseoli]